MYHMDDLMEGKLLYKERLERCVSSALDTGRVWAMLGLMEEPECGGTDCRGLSHLCLAFVPGVETVFLILQKACQCALQKCVFCLLAFKDDLQAGGQQVSLILLHICKFFSMMDGN